MFPIRQVREDRESARDLEDVQQQMNRLVDHFFGGWGFDLAPVGWREGWRAYTPTIDVVENDREVRVSAELPGMDEKDVEVSLADHVLTIRGEKTVERQDNGKHYHRMERSSGAFHRAFVLPAEVDQDKVDAAFKNGVLTITLSKTAEPQRQAKKIPVRSN